MRFWDASALVPLLVRQGFTQTVRQWRSDDPALVTWWGSAVECVSAIARLEREERLDRQGTAQALRLLETLASSWHEVQPSESLRQTARRLLRSHVLRSGDALQLAAALHAAEQRPATLAFVCLDDRLSLAAEREGFDVIGVGAEPVEPRPPKRTRRRA